MAAIYARYSSKGQYSVADQVRHLLEECLTRQLFVPRENVFFDAGITGRKRNRPGLNGLVVAAEAGRMEAVVILATNRLARNIRLSLQLVEETFVERGIRFISLSSPIDSAKAENWKAFLTFYGLFDEAMVGAHSCSIRASHEALFASGRVFGTLPIGFGAEPIEGMQSRKGKLVFRIIVDPDDAPIVAQIFEWFVRDRYSIAAIVQRLNVDPEIPVPPYASGQWTHRTIRGMLENTRYRGWWEYGKNENRWSSSKDSAQRIKRAEPLQSKQCEDLRIVSDALWYGAQQRLTVFSRNRGRRSKDGESARRPRLFNLLFYCPTHQQCLYV